MMDIEQNNKVAFPTVNILSRISDMFSPNCCRFLLFFMSFFFIYTSFSLVYAQKNTSHGPSSSEEVVPKNNINNYNKTTYPVVHTRSMNINYRVNMPPEKLNRVELWYMKGAGQSKEQEWQLYNFDDDKTSPIRFNAPGEGVYKFLVVAVDQYERRSIEAGGENVRSQGKIPDSVQPHQVVFVDYSRPKLYLQSPPADIENCETGRLKISWAGFDTHLQSRPVEIYYQQKDREEWLPVCPPQAAINDYFWEIPADIRGPVRIRIRIVDNAGQEDVQMTQWINIARKPTLSAEQGNGLSSDYGAGLSLTQPVVKQEAVPHQGKIDTEENAYPPNLTNLPAKKRAADPNKNAATNETIDPVQWGIFYERRKEWDKAMSVYQSVLEQDPKNAQAHLRLGYVYYTLGKFNEAEDAFNRFLKKNVNDQNGLYGVVLAQIAQERNVQAWENLKKLLAQNDQDYEAWLLLGDVASKMGEKKYAVECWLKAARSESDILVKHARERLERHDNP